MKNKTFNLIIAVAVIFASVVMTGCGSTKQQTATDYKPVEGSPFGEVFEAPCADKDTPEYFVGLGIANGSRNRMDVLQGAALTNAQNIARQKMQHAYRGMIADYSNYIGNNVGSDAETKVERAGNQIIDRIINDTQAECGPKFSGVDDKGNVTCYIGIRISKKQVADAIADHSNDEELKIRFNEQEFRKRMEEEFKKFKEN